MKRFLFVALLLALPMNLLAQSGPSEQALLAEAIALLRQSDDETDPATKINLVTEAVERLEQIVSKYPDSASARQLTGAGIPVMGGDPISLAALKERLADSCLIQPTTQCLLERALAVAKTIESHYSRATRMAEIAQRHFELGQIETGRKIIQQAIEEAKFDPNPGFRDSALRDIAKVQAQVGRFEAALKTVNSQEYHKQESLAGIAEVQANAGMIKDAHRLTVKITDPGDEGRALKAIAEAHIRSGNLDTALKTARSIRDEFHRPAALAVVGAALAESGRSAEADSVFRQAISEMRSYPISFRTGWAFTYVAESLAKAGSTAEARDLLSETVSMATSLEENLLLDIAAKTAAEIGFFDLSLSIARRQREEDQIYTSSYNKIVELKTKNGLYEEAVAVARNLKDRSKQDSAFSSISYAQAERGDFFQALSSIENISDEVDRQYALLSIALRYVESDQLDDSLQLLERLEEPFLRAKLIWHIVKKMTDKGRTKGVEELLDDAFKSFKQIKYPGYKVDILMYAASIPPIER